MPTLTDHRVDRAKLPESGQAFLWCSQDRGFGVRLNAAGTRTFVVQGRVDGRERRVSIGHRGALTVDQARDRARELLHCMRIGTRLGRCGTCSPRKLATAATSAENAPQRPLSNSSS